MSTRQRQRGLTMIGFLLVAVVVVVAIMIGARMLPAYVEWYSVTRVMSNTLKNSKDGFTVAQFRRDFDLQSSADYIDNVHGADIDVTKDGNVLVATATWTRVLHLVGNVSLLLEFEATATK